MLLLLISFLQNFFDIRLPAVFTYSSTRMALACITALLLILIFGKYFIKKLYEWKIGDRIRLEDCPLLGVLHRTKQDTPTMGGILIIFSLLVSLFLWMDWHSSFTLILLLTTLFMGGLGAYDDYLKLRYKNTNGLSARKKFSLQALFSLMVALYLLCPSVTELLHKKAWFPPPFCYRKANAIRASPFNHKRIRPAPLHSLCQKTFSVSQRPPLGSRIALYHLCRSRLFECRESHRWPRWTVYGACDVCSRGICHHSFYLQPSRDRQIFADSVYRRKRGDCGVSGCRCRCLLRLSLV